MKKEIPKIQRRRLTGLSFWEIERLERPASF